MDLLISIKPEFVKEIIAGKKKVEYRKKIFTKDVNRIYIYSTSPEKKIVGYFNYNGYLTGTPEEIWQKTKHVSGITSDFYFKYFKNRTAAYAIEIKDIVIFDKMIEPYSMVKRFFPPQSYKYIRRGDFD